MTPEIADAIPSTGIVWAWVITMPIAGLIGAAFYFLARGAQMLAG